jgi:hypothetical protein
MRHHASVFALRAIAACTLSSGLTLGMGWGEVRAEGLLRTSTARPAPISGQVGVEPLPLAGPPRVSTAREVPVPKDWQDESASPLATAPAAMGAPAAQAVAAPRTEPRTKLNAKPITEAREAKAQAIPARKARTEAAGRTGAKLALNAKAAPQGKATSKAMAKAKAKAKSKATQVARNTAQQPGRRDKAQQARAHAQKPVASTRLAALRTVKGASASTSPNKPAKAIIPSNRLARADQGAPQRMKAMATSKKAKAETKATAKAKAKATAVARAPQAQGNRRAASVAAAATPSARKPVAERAAMKSAQKAAQRAAQRPRRPAAKLAQAA